MRYYVIINGVNSLSIKGLAIKTLPSIIKPMMRTLREEIDGRNGDVITNLGYSAYDKQLEIGLYGEYDIDSIMAYFNQEGTIIFSDEDDKIYNFKILDQIDYAKLLKFRTAIVNLHIQPFKYPLEEEPIELIDSYVEGEGESLTLNETESAPLEIDLKGNTSQEVIPEETGTEVEGTSISVNDVVPTKEDYITLKGNTSQVQYSGKQLFNKSQTPSYYLKSSSTETATGLRATMVETAITSYVSYRLGGSELLGKNISLYSKITNSSTNTGRIRLYYGDNNSNARQSIGTLYNTGHFDFTSLSAFPQNCDSIYLLFTITLNNEMASGTYTDYEDVVVKIGTDATASDYEPYCGGTPSPNPSYPQDIHCVSGDNEIEVCGKNLFKADEVKNGTVNDTNGVIGGTTSPLNKYIELKVKGNTDYYILSNKTSGNWGAWYDESKTYISGFSLRTNTSGTKTSPANAKYMCFTINYNGNHADYTDVMITTSTNTTYEPYTGNIYPLYLGVENLQNGTTDFSNYVNYLVTNTKDDESITITSTANNTYAGTTFDKAIPKAGTYTLQMKATFDTNGLPSFRIGSSLYATKVLNTNYYLLYATFTTTSDNETISVSLYPSMTTNTSTHTAKFYDFQLVKGDKPQHTSTQPIELNKIGTYQDYIYKSGSKWYWHKEIKKALLGVDITFNSTTGGFYSASVNDYATSGNTPYCTWYKGISNVGAIGGVEDKQIAFNQSSSPYARLYLKDSNYSDATTLNSDLSSNSVPIYYALATPTDTEITDTTLISQLDDLYNATIYGTTNISSIPNDLEPYINLKYNVVTPSPSPERPSAIEVVSGTNTIKIANEDDSESQTLQIRLGSIKLRYVDEAQDYIYKSGDKWYIHALTGEKTFVGNSAEGWAMTSTPRGLKEFTAQISDMKKNSSIYCDNFTQVPETTQMAYETYTPSIATTNSKSVFIMLGDGSIASSGDFRTWLSTHNTTVVYPLNTAVDTEITDTDLLEDLEALLEATSYKPKTNITQTNNDKPFILYAKALKQGSGEAIVENEGNIYAKPTFEIEGTGLVQVLIDNNEVLEVDTTNDTIVIDTENMEATNKTDGTLANRQVVGDYSKIKLNVGNNDVKLTGNYTKGTITKYTRYL